MGAPSFEHGPIRPAAAWVLSGMTIAGWIAVLVQTPPGTPPAMTAFVMAVAAVPMAGFAAPMCWAGRHRIRVDGMGVWQDDDLLVPADAVVAVGVHVQRVSTFPQTRPGGRRWGRDTEEFRFHGRGSVYVPRTDRRAASQLPIAMSEVVVADGRRGARGRRPGRAVAVPRRRARAFVDAVLAVAPQVDAPTQILEPELVQSLWRAGVKKGPGYEPPLEEWSWDQGTELPS